MVILDSLPFGGANDETQLPMNPADYLSTPYVQEMLAMVAYREGLARASASSLSAPESSTATLHGAGTKEMPAEAEAFGICVMNFVHIKRLHVYIYIHTKRTCTYIYIYIYRLDGCRHTSLLCMGRLRFYNRVCCSSNVNLNCILPSPI